MMSFKYIDKDTTIFMQKISIYFGIVISIIIGILLIFE